MSEKVNHRSKMRVTLVAAAAAATAVGADVKVRGLRDIVQSLPVITSQMVSDKKAKASSKREPEAARGEEHRKLLEVYRALRQKLNGVALESRGLEVRQYAYEAFCRELEIFCEKFAHFRVDEKYHQNFTLETFSLISRINSEVNKKIKPTEDLILYGVEEKWTIPHDAGDCEDYVLLKMVYLLDAGFSPLDLHIIVAIDENNRGHAILGVDVYEEGLQNTLILDNIDSNILTLDEMAQVYRGRRASFVTRAENKFKVRFYEYATKRGQ